MATTRSSSNGSRIPPHFRVCYLCGQQFGSASIGIHVPQCYAKKLSQWMAADPHTRGNKPKNPDTVNWKEGKNATAAETNAEQYREFESNLVPCPGCGRTFLPDRLPVHMRGCKAAGGKAIGKGGAAKASARASTAPGGAASSKRLGGGGGRPALPTCYLCGQQFGTTSIGIHVPQCYAKKLAQWMAADPRARGNPPKDPDTVNWRGRGATAAEQAESQFQEFVSNLEPCPHCGRRFLPDRLVVHLRSCRPGNTAKRPTTAIALGTAAAAPAGGPPLLATTPERGALGAEVSDGAPRAQTAKVLAGAGADDGADRINPKVNRLPKSAAPPRVCPHCGSTEYDAAAKFCRECGHNLNSKVLRDPCSHCGEAVTEGSRFCATCGHPVNGATASERAEGGENGNTPTVRVVTCPGCRAVSDADGNFCDNCGAALGEAEPTAPAEVVVSSMYCAACNEAYDDMSALYCEECGGKLEVRRERVVHSDPPPSAAKATVTPSMSKRLSRSEAPPKRPAKKAARPPTTATTATSTATKVAGTSTQGSGKAAAPKTVRIDAEEPKPKKAPFPGDSGGGGDALSAAPFAPPEDAGDRQECPSCGRFFAPEPYAKHVVICAKQKARPVFNSSKKRLSDVDVKPKKGNGASSKGTAGSTAAAAPKKNWKAESEAFRRALREARQADSVLKAGGTAKDLPPPTYSENPDYIQCPHCQRRFAPDVAERHIPRCANTTNRPKPPPKKKK